MARACAGPETSLAAASGVWGAIAARSAGASNPHGWEPAYTARIRSGSSSAAGVIAPGRAARTGALGIGEASSKYQHIAASGAAQPISAAAVSAAPTSPTLSVGP